MQEDGLQGAGPEAVQVHDDERSRPAGRGESARPAVHGRRRRISAGSATRRSSSSARAASCIWRRSSICSRGSSSGWAVSAVNDRHLTLKALEMALKRRCPEAGLAASLRPGLHVRQRGLPTDARCARDHLQHEPPRQLLRQRGDGSFFSTVKSETADRFASCGEAKMELFDYIEVFYNQRRRHSTLGQISPADFERRQNEEGVDPMENRHRTRFPTGSTPIVSFNERRKDHEDRSTQRHRPLNRISVAEEPRHPRRPWR